MIEGVPDRFWNQGYLPVEAYLPGGCRLLEPKELASLLIEYHRDKLSHAQRTLVKSIGDSELLSAGLRIRKEGDEVLRVERVQGPPQGKNREIPIFGTYLLNNTGMERTGRGIVLTFKEVNDRCPALVRDFLGRSLI